MRKKSFISYLAAFAVVAGFSLAGTVQAKAQSVVVSHGPILLADNTGEYSDSVNQNEIETQDTQNMQDTDEEGD